MPAQRALPMRPVTTGKPWLPEHAYVPAARVQATGGYAVVSDVVKFLGRDQPGVELLPDQLASGNVLGGIPGPLVEPREDHVARLSQ